MAAILCSTHGGQIAHLTSSTLMKNIVRKEYRTVEELCYIDIMHFEQMGRYIVDRKYVMDHNLQPDTLVILSDDDHKKGNIYADLVPVCAICRKEYLEKIGYSIPPTGAG